MGGESSFLNNDNWATNCHSTPRGTRVKIFGGAHNLEGLPNFLGPLEGFAIPQVVDRQILTQLAITSWLDIGLPEVPGRVYIINVFQEPREIIVAGHKIIPMDDWLSIYNEEFGQSFRGHHLTI